MAGEELAKAFDVYGAFAEDPRHIRAMLTALGRLAIVGEA